jgi:hypothetical protein
VKLTTTRFLALLAFLACVAIITGVSMEYGPWWGLTIGGVLTLIGVVVLYDPNPKQLRR